MQTFWKQEYNLKELNSLARGTMLEALNIKFEEIGEDFLTASMPVNKSTRQPMGLLHGGASVTLAETVGSVASMLCIEDLDKYAAVGIHIDANHLKSMRTGQVLAVCSPVRIGSKLHVWHIELMNEEEEMICISRLTTMIIEKNHDNE